jgi:excisionase family DNA binding protein
LPPVRDAGLVSSAPIVPVLFFSSAPILSGWPGVVNVDQVNVYSGPVARTLDSEEAARRLGVKVTTLYAYVSRGRVRSYPAPDGRRSLFDADEVEALARGRGADRRGDGPPMTITTAITQLRDDGPVYRGRPAATLARTGGFEAAAELLWAETAASAGNWDPPELPADPDRGTADRLRGVVVDAGATDP